MAPKQVVRKQKASSSRPPPPVDVPQLDMFVDEAHAAYFPIVSACHITESRYIDQSALRYPVSGLFSQSTLMNLLSLTTPYNSTFLYTLLANMEISGDRMSLVSRVEGRDVVLTRADFHALLGLSLVGPAPDRESSSSDFDWAALNLTLFGAAIPRYQHEKKYLMEEASVIQSILKQSVVPKVGDRGTISAHVSVATYFIMTGTVFDEVDFIFSYISRMLTACRRVSKLKQNVALGSMFTFLLRAKYDLQCSSLADCAPAAFTNASFNVIWPSGSNIALANMAKRRRPTIPIPGSAPAPTPAASSSAPTDLASIAAALARLEENQCSLATSVAGLHSNVDEMRDMIDDIGEGQNSIAENVVAIGRYLRTIPRPTVPPPSDPPPTAD